MTTATTNSEAGREVSTEKEKWLRVYRQMVSIRLFEEQVNELYTRALMPGLAHLYSGEEAVAVGICEALGRATAFGLEAASVDGQDVRAVNEIASRLVRRARAGGGPAFLQADTYRYSGHHVGDINREYYRSKQEEQHWKSDRDPIKLHSKWLLDRAYTDAASLERITSEVRSEMESAVKFAIAAPYPSVEEVEKHVYA